MELNQKVVAELRHLRYAVYLVALGLVVVAISSIYPWLSLLWQNNAAPVSPEQQVAQTSQCGSGGEAFYNEASALFEKAKYKDLVGFSEKRLAACPSDEFAWWWKAKALALDAQWEPALAALERTVLLKPDWRTKYVEPMRGAIEYQRSQKRKIQ